jgi:hypothetical protein
MKYKEYSYVVEKQRNEEEYGVIISTDQEDRSGDVIVSTGIKYDKYLSNNPVVLFQHGRDPVVGSAPIAKATSMKTFMHKLESKFVFAEGDVHADRIKNLWNTGFLNACSVGLIPLKVEDIESKDKDDIWAQMFPPQRILESELVEYSLVGIPMNAGAVRKSIDEQFLKLIGIIETKITPVDDILKQVQELNNLIRTFQRIEKTSDVDEKIVPYVPYAFTQTPWDILIALSTETVNTYAYAYGEYAPHHMIENGNIVTSFEAVCMGLARINGAKKDIEGAKQAYDHLSKHYDEYGQVLPPDFAPKQWTSLQVISFLRKHLVSEDNILLTLNDCGIPLQESLKMVKSVTKPEPTIVKTDEDNMTSDEYDKMLRDIMESCNQIVSLV